jgi:hypothetical protein
MLHRPSRVMPPGVVIIQASHERGSAPTFAAAARVSGCTLEAVWPARVVDHWWCGRGVRSRTRGDSPGGCPGCAQRQEGEGARRAPSDLLRSLKILWGPSCWTKHTRKPLPCSRDGCGAHAGGSACEARPSPRGGDGLGLSRLQRTRLHHGHHADECGERPGLHLLHDMGAVGLNGLFARAQGRGNFLVQQPRGDQAQDVPLPWGQGGDALLQLGGVALVVARPSVLLQRGGDRCQQGLGVYRLLEEIDRAPPHGPDTQGGRPIAGEEDDGRAPRRLTGCEF